MAKTAKRRSAKKAGKARRAADGGVAVRLGPTIRAVRDAKADLRGKRARASSTETIDRFVDAATAFLDVWGCQAKTMTRRF